MCGGDLMNTTSINKKNEYFSKIFSSNTHSALMRPGFIYFVANTAGNACIRSGYTILHNGPFLSQSITPLKMRFSHAENYFNQTKNAVFWNRFRRCTIPSVAVFGRTSVSHYQDCCLRTPRSFFMSTLFVELQFIRVYMSAHANQVLHQKLRTCAAYSLAWKMMGSGDWSLLSGCWKSILGAKIRMPLLVAWVYAHMHSTSTSWSAILR